MSQKCFEEKHVDLSLRGEENKKHYLFIKDFNTFICMIIHYIMEKKHCLLLLFTSFSTEKILKCCVKHGKQMINK